ncbi:MAG TPA: tRNA pseudouridine(38-40) synthase TruA [Verrucomicrobia bacterium]|nr:MAG: tRNA pseudouridine(38-40) synthase TruA [Lentisphaerae bacterium GWF2_57_35]HBA83036.1 tRNA pseudouridine(38-40) synthase TruA [Verrucomicrobiota bacterium]
MTQRYKMMLGYDGTLYAGWQTQPEHRTVQGELERVLQELTGEQTRIHSSGRTDRGVHARAQVVHFDLEKPVVCWKLMRGFNALLKDDIRILTLAEAASDFHARYGTKGKEYRYFIWNGPVMPPAMRFYRTWVRPRLDVKAMQAAADRLVGNNDFAAFSANPNREIEGTVRHLRELTVRRHGREITLVAGGDGFLYKMVRSLAGFLIRVGTGELQPDAASTILSSKVRTARVPTAAPQGLFLWRVDY